MIARPLLMESKLPLFAWEHAILHATTLVRIQPTNYYNYSPLQLAFGYEPNISHLRIFGCAIYVPISLPPRTKLGPPMKIAIIKYIEPLTCDLFTAWFIDRHFDESHFSTIEGGKDQPKKKIKDQPKKEINWRITLDVLDPRTKDSELEVQKIIRLQRIVNQLPDAFNDSRRVTKSHIPTENVLVKIDVH